MSGVYLTLNLLTTTIVAPPSNASKWQMGFNSAFIGLKYWWKVKFIQLFGGKIWRKKDYLEVLVVEEIFIQVNLKEIWSYAVYEIDLVHGNDEA